MSHTRDQSQAFVHTLHINYVTGGLRIVFFILHPSNVPFVEKHQDLFLRFISKNMTPRYALCEGFKRFMKWLHLVVTLLSCQQ